MVIILTWYNASVHKGARVQELINKVGALLRFLPAYSSDLNPIEEVFAEVKGYLKANDGVFKATSSPKTLINLVFSSIPKDNCVIHSSFKIFWLNRIRVTMFKPIPIHYIVHIWMGMCLEKRLACSDNKQYAYINKLIFFSCSKMWHFWSMTIVWH